MDSTQNLGSGGGGERSRKNPKEFSKFLKIENRKGGVHEVQDPTTKIQLEILDFENFRGLEKIFF